MLWSFFAAITILSTLHTLFLTNWNAGGVIVLDQPVQSPDLNPIEDLWYKLNIETKLRSVKTLDDLVALLQKAWNEAITAEYLEAIALSMCQRCLKVIETKGMPIDC